MSTPASLTGPHLRCGIATMADAGEQAAAAVEAVSLQVGAPPCGLQPRLASPPALHHAL